VRIHGNDRAGLEAGEMSLGFEVILSA